MVKATIIHPSPQELFTPLPRPKSENPAQWAYERIAKTILEYEEKLDPDQEIGLRLVSTPNSVMHIENIGYWGPDMLTFYGTNEHGLPVTLMQHYTQMSIMLTAVPKIDEKANRIGFHLMSKLDEND